MNPVTFQNYSRNIHLRGDYTRVLAEFWADGPGFEKNKNLKLIFLIFIFCFVDSETPPGHWNTLLNSVMDHDEFEFKWGGRGEVLPVEQYALRAYVALNGALHDSAIAAWGAKGHYDYVRPISAVRYMATRGNSTHHHLREIYFF